MLLTVDIGNTHIDFAVFDNGTYRLRWAIKTNESQPHVDQWMALILPALNQEGLSRKDISGVMISSVVPPFNASLISFCRQTFDADVFIIGDEHTTVNLTINTKKPEEVGGDLIAAAVGALSKYAPPFLILDSGTATTLTLIDEMGALHGVVIAPGAKSLCNALTASASLLPSINFEEPLRVLCQDTIPAMQSGVYWGFLGMIEKIVEASRKECQKIFGATHIPLIAAGNVTKKLASFTDVVNHIEEDLIHQGLQQIYKDTMDYQHKKAPDVFFAS